jgi:hypothetical protein
VKRELHRQVDAGVEASGPHDFTVRIGALRLGAPKTSIAARTNVRDDRETPLVRARAGRMCGIDLPDGTRGIFSTLRHATAANGHDGQIT